MYGFRKITEALLGTSVSREHHKIQLNIYKNVCSNFELLKDLAPPPSGLSYSPIFILSAGWRSGSTLLQRLILSSEGIVVWGEPFDKSSIVRNLSNMFLPFCKEWPPENYCLKEESFDHLKSKWIANLYPQTTDLIEAHRAFLLRLFFNFNNTEDIARWGIKEVRFGLKEALYLKIIFPDARFLYLKRDLFSAYKSYSNFSPLKKWYSDWPHGKAFTPFQFARHRRRLVQEFKTAIKLTGGLMINYEDLICGNLDLEELDDYCDIKVDRNVLNKKVGSGLKTEKVSRINFIENVMLKLGAK